MGLLWETIQVSGWQLLQFAIGFLLAAIISQIPVKTSLVTEAPALIPQISVATLAGILLPFGVYGLLPMIIVLSRNRNLQLIIPPLLISNAIFNTLTIFTDPGFTWRTGIARIILAFLAGLLAGIVFTKTHSAAGQTFRTHQIWCGSSRTKTPLLINTAMVVAILVIGTCVNLLFHKYCFNNVMNLIYRPQLGSLVKIFISVSVKPAFLLAMTIITSLFDLTRLGVLCLIFKTKGIALYFGYNLALVTLLVLSSFI